MNGKCFKIDLKRINKRDELNAKRTNAEYAINPKHVEMNGQRTNEGYEINAKHFV